MFDIIIPHFNSEQKLLKLLDSIPDNDRFNVIIVDDCSTDNLGTLYCYINERRNISLIENKENKGAGACRNIGLRNSKSDWVIFADSDDFFLNNFNETLYHVFSDINSNSNIDLIFFSPQSCDEFGNQSFRHVHYADMISNYLKKPDSASILNLRAKFVVPWSKIYSREMIFKNNIWFDEIKVANDVMFSTKCGLAAREIMVTGKSIYCAVRIAGSLSTAISEERFMIRFDVFLKYNNYLQNKLKASEYNELDILGYDFVLNSFKYRMRINKKLNILQKLRENHVRIFSVKKISLINIKSKFSKSIDEYKYEKK